MRFIRKMIHDFIDWIVPRKLRRNMMTCEQVSHIIAENQQLKPLKKFKLQMHLFICQKCLDYKEQIHFLESNAKVIQLKPLDKNTKQKMESCKHELLNKYLQK